MNKSKSGKNNLIAIAILIAVLTVIVTLPYFHPQKPEEVAAGLKCNGRIVDETTIPSVVACIGEVIVSDGKVDRLKS